MKKKKNPIKYKKDQKKLEEDILFDLFKLSEKDTKKKKPSKQKKEPSKPKKKLSKKERLERAIIKDIEKLELQEELEIEIAKDIDKIAKQEFKPPDYKKLNPDDLRYEGKFVSDEFNELIMDLAEASGRHPQDLLDSSAMRDALDGVIKYNQFTNYNTIPSLVKSIKAANKETITIVNTSGESYTISAEELFFRLSEMEQKLNEQKDLVYIGIKNIHRLDGTFIVFLPDIDFEDYDLEDLEEFLDSEDVEYLIYEEKTG